MLSRVFGLFTRPARSSPPGPASMPSQVINSLVAASAPVGVFQTDLKGNCVFVNERWCHFTGLSQKQATGQGWILAVHPEDRADFFSAWARAIDERNEFAVECRLVKTDGSVTWVKTVAVPCRSEDGHHSGFVGAMVDISERRQMEQSLRDSEAKLRAVFDSVIDGIVIIDTKGIITSFNIAASRIFGWSAKDVIGQPVTVLMPESLRTSHQDHITWLLDGGAPKSIGFSRQLVGMRRDGAQFPLEIAVSEFRSGTERMFAGVVRDISERKLAENMKDELIGVISREMRDPLNAISGSLALLQGSGGGDLPSRTAEQVTLARKNCSRLMTQLDDILDMESLGNGRVGFRKERVDLAGLVERAIDIARFFGPSTRIELHNDVGRAPVDGDAARIVQLVGNLLSNAVKHSPAEEVVEVTLVRRGHWWRVAVTDHGNGIPRQFRARVFQRFSRTESATGRTKPGIGLGLAISHSIVTRLGGHIGFDSVEHRGCTFWFELPVASEGEHAGEGHVTGLMDRNIPGNPPLFRVFARAGAGE